MVRILFITSNRIGDAVLSNGVLQSMLEQYPGARVTVVAGGAAASLYEAVPGLEEIISLKKEKHHIHWLKLWGRCFLRYWDVVVDMRRSGVSYFLLTGRRLIVPVKDEKLHRIVELSRMLKNETTPSPVVWTDPLHDGRALELVPTGLPVLAVGPAANWSGKQWPIDRFIALVEQLTGDGGILPGARLAILAAPQEREQILSLYSVLPQERVIDLVGQDLVTVAACLRRCDLFIGNDSGLMHLAAAAGTRTLGLFGPSPEWRYHPWGADCACVRTPEGYKEMTNHPEFDYSHGVPSYMENLKLETVVTAAEELYRRGMK